MCFVGGFTNEFGDDVIFAVPSTSEKGYLDVQIEVETPGGHSSVPPPHTSIGILASLIVALESTTHAPTLLRSGTPFAAIQCVTSYGPNIPDTLKQLARRAAEDDEALAQLAQAIGTVSSESAVMLKTTQAVDLVEGGVKVNALPEKAKAIVNHRIAEHRCVCSALSVLDFC